MSYSSSVARVLSSEYSRDYSVEKPVEQKRQAATRLKVVETKSEAKSLSFITFKSVVTFMVVVAGICIMLYNQVLINEVNGQIKAVNGEITTLQSEYVRMQSNLESTFSYRNVEKIAEEELGLQRIDPNQIEYLYIYSDDRVEVIGDKEPEGFSGKVEAATISLLNTIKDLFTDK